MATVATGRRGARARRLPLHHRQGLPAAHRRPGPDAQPAQEDRTWTAAALMADWGVAPGAGGRLPGAGRRQRGQRPRRRRASAPKTAAKLLQQYGTLDNLVAHVDEVKQPKLKENLKKAIATGDLEKSRKLVRLDTNVPMHARLGGLAPPAVGRAEAAGAVRGVGLPRVRAPGPRRA